MRYDPDRALSLRLPPGLRDRLDAVAAKRGTTRHNAAVDAITTWVSVMERRAAQGSSPAAPAAPSTPERAVTTQGGF